jgi:hypothetical protein
MNIDENWKIVEQPLNYVLMERRKTLRPNAKTAFKWCEEGFYGSELSALEAFVRKSVNGVSSVEEVLESVYKAVDKIKEYVK